MFPYLPKEVFDRIAYYLPFEKAVGVSEYMKGKLGDKADWRDYAKNGNVFGLEWLHYHEKEGCTYRVVDIAAMEGQLDVVRWLHMNRNEGFSKNTMDCAATNGHLDIVKWLHENRSEGCTPQAMDGAAENGHLDVILWLHENRIEGCSTVAMDRAAGKGYFDVVKWLHENRSEGCTSYAIRMDIWKLLSESMKTEVKAVPLLPWTELLETDTLML